MPVNPNKLRSPKIHFILVIAAGPLSNLLQAIFWALIFSNSASEKSVFDGESVNFIQRIAEFGVLINILLAVLNSLPILPLDGGRILCNLLPTKISTIFQKTEDFGLFILSFLLLSGILADYWLTPLTEFLLKEIQYLPEFTNQQ
ncbi:MAG: hypothetical protein CBC42_04800 [Betaproteobacteria bacterium TMED82]|nr:MAG: hypothetical protein CBC42_04800 [Betaproteobacteria bacterium TMED82]